MKTWEVHLKSLVDSYRTCKFVVSGSAIAALKFKSIENGTGRFTDFLFPLSSMDEHLGNMVETAIFSQWMHRDWFTPWYARWNRGEVNMVCLSVDILPFRKRKGFLKKKSVLPRGFLLVSASDHYCGSIHRPSPPARRLPVFLFIEYLCKYTKNRLYPLPKGSGFTLNYG